jgi:hypothetical protein
VANTCTWYPNNQSKSKKQRALQQARNTAIRLSLGSASLFTADPFPPRTRRVLRYAETFQFTTGAAGVLGTEQVMRLNSLFDPNSTGVGHQPYGFDQLALLYAKYRVLTCHVELRFTTPGAANDILCVALFSGVGNILTLTGASPDYITECGRAKTAHLSSAGSRYAVIKTTIPIHKIAGVPESTVLNESDWAAQNNANPTNVATVTFSVGSYSGQGGEAVSCQVVLLYDSLFYDRIGVTQS